MVGEVLWAATETQVTVSEFPCFSAYLPSSYPTLLSMFLGKISFTAVGSTGTFWGCSSHGFWVSFDVIRTVWTCWGLK